MRRSGTILAFLAPCLLFLSSASGQTAAAPSPAAQTGGLAPVDVTPKPEGVGDGMFIPLLKDQPFKIRFNVEISKPRLDGSLVKQKYAVTAARDSAGYEYRELRDPVPANSDMEPALVSSVVYDPKNSTATICRPSNHGCTRRSFDPTQERAPEPPLGTTVNGNITLVRESLGKKRLNGLEVDGIRETQTEKQGTGEKPLITIRETWYSAQLALFLSVKVTDPFGATRTVEAADVKLGEPDEALFTIPANYRIFTPRGGVAPPMTTLEQAIAQHLSGVSADRLTAEVNPVDAAILNYAKSHAAAAPNDPQNGPLINMGPANANDPHNSRLVALLRSQLVMELQAMQTMDPQMIRSQTNGANARMDAAYSTLTESPCISKPVPGDPPTMPVSAAALESEQQAWVQMRDTWAAFLRGLFPNSDSAAFGFMLTNSRANDLRRMQNVQRIRGCIPTETMEASLERVGIGQTPQQLSASLKPVNAALNAYIRAHMADAPADNEREFALMTEQRFASDLQLQRAHPFTRDQFEEAELHLNQVFRSVVESSCLDRHVPGDPPNAPASGEAFRAEETAWVAMRDAWVGFVASLYPTNPSGGFGFAITEQRAAELRQVQNIERNRGCRSGESN